MMFNGSKNVAPKEYDRILESNGGFSNAFTDHDMTAYYEDIASDRLEVVFRLDSDRMAALSLLTPSSSRARSRWSRRSGACASTTTSPACSTSSSTPRPSSPRPTAGR